MTASIWLQPHIFKIIHFETLQSNQYIQLFKHLSITDVQWKRVIKVLMVGGHCCTVKLKQIMLLPLYASFSRVVHLVTVYQTCYRVKLFQYDTVVSKCKFSNVKPCSISLTILETESQIYSFNRILFHTLCLFSFSNIYTFTSNIFWTSV